MSTDQHNIRSDDYVHGWRARHVIQTLQATKNFTAWILGNNGENMGNNGEPDATDSRSSIDSHREIDSRQEMEYRLNSLRLLVCELIKTNQELRDALQDAKIDSARSRDLQSPNMPGMKGTL
jgi:hypothetical protein